MYLYYTYIVQKIQVHCTCLFVIFALSKNKCLLIKEKKSALIYLWE